MSGGLSRKHLARRGHLEHVSLGDRRPAAFRPDLPGDPFVREIVDWQHRHQVQTEAPGRRCLLVAVQDGAGEVVNGDRLVITQLQEFLHPSDRPLLDDLLVAGQAVRLGQHHPKAGS